ncbi:MAG: TRAP transporter large permease subunit [Hyphomicrobiaceae bacterium]|nr:MAG: TRAP transporter large permease subunit [Hyphomicrobiaceae bacterium]
MTWDALIGLIMLLVLLGAIFIGVPISFTLLFLAFTFGYVGMGHTVFDLAYFQTIGMMKEELLAAVPLFIFMGFITEQAGLMERLFTAFRLLLAPIRGALYLVVILTATVFAMATGIVGAAVTVLGIMASPIMIKSGYDAKLSAGTITAGGTLGILIPPSVMLIVMGPVLGVSVADLYAAAFGPGFLLAGLYVAYLMGRSLINPKLGPPVPKEERVHSLGVMLREVLIGVVPLLGLIAATLGSILAGLATPTEAAGIGTAGAMALALAYRKLTFAGLQRALNSTMATSSMVLLLAVTSNIFGAVFARLGTANWITNTLLSFQLPPTLMLIMVLVLIFLLGWPFEWPAIILVFLPIFYPVVKALDIDLVWFGALTAVTLQTAFLSPPVAMSAYYLKQVVKDWSLATIYNGMFQFMILQVICIAMVLSFPKIALWFPETLQEASRAQKIPEEHQKIIDLQKRTAPSLEDDDWGRSKK